MEFILSLILFILIIRIAAVTFSYYIISQNHSQEFFYCLPPAAEALYIPKYWKYWDEVQWTDFVIKGGK